MTPNQSEHDRAMHFLRSLEQQLHKELPTAGEVRAKVEEFVKQGKHSKESRHKAFREGAFLNEFVVKQAHDFLRVQPSFDEQKACKALLSESYRARRGIASGSPKRKDKQKDYVWCSAA